MPKIIQVRNFYNITEDEWRILNAIETGMRNHEFVGLDMISDFAGIQQSYKNLVNSLRNVLVTQRLVAYENTKYRLTNLGYDFLALHKFVKSNIVSNVLNIQFFATGKESDLYMCKPGPKCEELEIKRDYPIVLKFHRLGRTSFRQVKNKREYKTGNNCSWLYLNRISATREFLTMKELYDAKLPVPIPLCHNRGAVAMEYVTSCPLFKFSHFVLKNGAAEVLYTQAKNLLIKLAQLGLVHGDFNEFNLLVEVKSLDSTDDFFKDSVDTNSESDGNNSQSSSDEDDDFDDEEDDDERSETFCENSNNDCPYLDQDVSTFKLIMIDFPQVISRSNKTAPEIFSRDRQGLIKFFEKFTVISDCDLPPLDLEDIQRTDYLDVKLKAPGYPRDELRRIKQEREMLLESDDDNKTETIGRSSTVSAFVKRISVQKEKQSKRVNIYKQKRNINKKESLKDMRADYF